MAFARHRLLEASGRYDMKALGFDARFDGQAPVRNMHRMWADPKDVVTTAEAARLLRPLIKPLPSFDEMVLGRKA